VWILEEVGAKDVGTGRPVVHQCLGLVFCLFLGVAGTGDAYAQNRFGGGLQLAGSTAAQDTGPGLHLRTSIPMNREFSLGLGGTFTGFLFGGNEQGAYAMDMNASIIVTWPNPTPSSLYMLGGAGYHLPMGDRYRDPSATTGGLEVKSGPTFHVGLGHVWQLESISLYVELAPTLFFRRERSDVMVPLRGGVIF